MHLGVAHEEHHKLAQAPSCCHSESQPTCHETPSPGIQEDDCCTVSTTHLDDSLLNSEKTLNNLVLAEKSSLISHRFTTEKRVKVQGPIKNTGPPLYVRLHKLILYA